MITLLPPAHHPLHQTPAYNPHARPLVVQKNQAVSDSFGNPERTKLLQLLKNPAIFEAVLDETHKPTPDVKYLRALLAKQKVSTKELFTSPELQVNFYDHLAKELADKSQKAHSKEKQQDLKLQSAMMTSVAKRIREQSGLPVTPYKSTPVFSQETTHQANRPKFGGLMVGLFNDVVRAFSEQGDWRSMTEAQRRKKAKKIIDWGSAIAGTSAGTLTKLMFADDAALTAVTVGTITNLSYSIYGQKGVDSSTLAVILGKIATVRLADGGLELAAEKGLAMIPLLGEITTGVSAYGVHKTTGKLFLEYFEHQIKRNREPKLPASISALASALNLADAADLVDFDGGAQQDLNNTLNDLRIAQGDYEPGPSSFMDSHSGLHGNGSIQEIRTLLDQNGNLSGFRGKDDVAHKLLSKTSDVRNVYKLFEALSKTSPNVARHAYKEFRDNGDLSYTTAAKILDEAKNITAGTLALFGDPDCVAKMGLLESSPASLAFVPGVGAMYEAQASKEEAKSKRLKPQKQKSVQTENHTYGSNDIQNMIEANQRRWEASQKPQKQKSVQTENHTYGSNDIQNMIEANRRHWEASQNLQKQKTKPPLPPSKQQLLYRAALKNDSGTVNKLIQAGVDINKPDSDGQTPLYKATLTGDVNAMALLLKAGANANQSNAKNSRSLVWQADMNFIEEKEISIDSSDPYYYSDQGGDTPLIAAAFIGNTKKIKRLIQAGVDIEKPDNHGYTPLIASTFNTENENTLALLQAGANVNKIGLSGVTPLHSASVLGSSEKVKTLLQAGSKVNATMEGGVTPLHLAAGFGTPENIQVLIQAGANMHAASEDGGTPLHMAAGFGVPENIQALIQAGAKINAISQDRCTPLYTAAKYGKVDNLRMLVKAGADINKADEDGTTPLQVAKDNGHSAVVQALEGYRKRTTI